MKSHYAACLLLLAVTTSCAVIGGLDDFQRNACGDSCATAADATTDATDGASVDAMVDTAVDTAVDAPADASDGGSDADAADAAPDAPVDFATITVTVSGLVGSGLIMRDNGADDVLISANGPFTFPAKVQNGAAYAVTVSSQPSNPSQTCIVANGSGTVAGANVTNVTVTCSTVTYSIGGTVSGLGSVGLVLTNNGGNDLPVAASGPFTFGTLVPSGTGYVVAVKTQPASGNCVVSGGTGSVGGANVTSVVVNCAANTYTIGGNISGLNGTVVLQDNGGNNLTVNNNGSFAFSTPLADTAAYAVTVLTQPTYSPRNQTCVVSSGSGNVAGANVTTVAIVCTTNSFTVGGSISGLSSGTVVLKNNGGDSLTRTTNGNFTFATSVLSGNTYSVSVSSQPAGLVCRVSSSSGTVRNGPVTSVNVNCGPPTIRCGGGNYCTVGTQFCCFDNGPSSGVCDPNATVCASPLVSVTCNDVTDCPSSSYVCCAIYATAGNVLQGTTCQSSSSNCVAGVGQYKQYWCDSNISSGGCPNGWACTGNSNTPGFDKCE